VIHEDSQAPLFVETGTLAEDMKTVDAGSSVIPESSSLQTSFPTVTTSDRALSYQAEMNSADKPKSSSSNIHAVLLTGIICAIFVFRNRKI
jgi:hypothetical protein